MPCYVYVENVYGMNYLSYRTVIKERNVYESTLTIKNVKKLNNYKSNPNYVYGSYICFELKINRSVVN